MSEWRTIDSAPKNGSRVLLLVPNRGNLPKIIGGRWDTNKYTKRPRPYWTNDLESLNGVGHTRSIQPTHWMPLPEPPSDATP